MTPRVSSDPVASSFSPSESMSKEDKYPDWFLWALEHFGELILAAVLVAAMGFGGLFFMGRLADIEDQLSYAPPRSYQPPDLDQYDAGDMTVEQLTERHVVYAPVYSHIYYHGGSAYPLETTLSIRNVDTSHPVYIESVEYFDTSGKLARTQVENLIKLRPLQTISFLIEQRDSTGGSGANFLVRWGSDSMIAPPLIETIMVGNAGTQAIAFARSGVEVSKHQASND
jgi:hypothetical protein